MLELIKKEAYDHEEVIHMENWDKGIISQEFFHKGFNYKA